MVETLIQIDVYSYPVKVFLDSRTVPLRVFKKGEPVVSNADEINGKVEEVRKKFGLKKDNVCFHSKLI